MHFHSQQETAPDNVQVTNVQVTQEASRPLQRDLLIGLGAGLLASAAATLVDRLLDPLISDDQKRREKEVREGSPHGVAGPRLARTVLGRELSDREEQAVRTAFAAMYGLVWGVVYTLARRQAPQLSRFMGIPFAVPFYVACDGVIAPLLGLTPTIHKVPWQLDAKELANHTAWTATAEMVHRYSRNGS